MTFRPEDHTFAVCAYGESPYLEACLESLRAQREKTNILIATATPNPMIQRAGEKYGIPVRINRGERGIGADWNFALGAAGTPLVTLAHQDDLYDPGYAGAMLADLNRSRDPILWFCDYAELRGEARETRNRNLRIKRAMLLPLRIRRAQGSRWIRRRILSLGSPIGCPAVTYVTAKTGADPFSTEMRVSLDWDQWERLSRKAGDFCYRPEVFMAHRVHAGSATTAMIADHRRGQEDLAMFRRFWPEPVARFLQKRYARSEDQNQIGQDDQHRKEENSA